MSCWQKTTCLLLILMSIIAVLSACSSGNQNRSKGSMEAMKQIPSDAGSYVYFDMAALNSDSDLRPLYDPVRAGVGQGIVTELGVNFNDINGFAIAGTDSSSDYIVLDGNFDFNKVRKSLQDAGAEKTEYMNIETWTVQVESETLSYALTQGTIFAGANDTGNNYIEVIIGKTKSLYDNKGFVDVVSRLPKMTLITAATIGGVAFPNCIAIAWGFEKIDATTLGLTFVGKFMDAVSASRSLADLRNWVLTSNDGYNLQNVQSVQEGEFVKVTATLPISEL
jgi:hypothetical protein